jgi:hypothetical protein
MGVAVVVDDKGAGRVDERLEQPLQGINSLDK